jgi:glutamine synthetase
MLRDALSNFERDLIDLMRKNPYIFDHLPIGSADDIEKIVPTCATELEFWVKTPEESADREQLSTAETLKEQYWKRTVGPVRTALERTLILLDEYGFGVEMGHKEVGGVKAKMGHSGHYDHIMEQLEIDWRYSDPMGTADKDNLARYVIKDVFRSRGLDVTFMAKPVEGVAGSGKHTHFGAAVKLKDGRKVNLFSALDPEKDYLSPVGFGALMGLLKHYEIINPLASATTDSLNRLKPGYEAPICIVTSLGRDVKTPSRNRTVLAGLIRDAANPLATRFELRSPNPKSNCYLVLAGGFLAMLDGIEKCLAAKKSPADLAASISKKYGDEDFYLEKDRVYRAENNIFTDYTAEEREKYFGRSPATVYENIMAFDEYPEKAAVLFKGDAMTPKDLASYKQAVLELWATELHDRIIPQMAAEGSPASGITALSEALEAGDYAAASEKLKELRAL